jgi:single-strand DNA-binding protein
MYKNAGLNKIILVGQIIKEPRWHLFDQERQLCFTLLTTEMIRSQHGEQEHQEFHHIRIAASASFIDRFTFKKDDVIYLQGKLHTYTYTDEQQIKRYKTVVIATAAELFAPVSQTVNTTTTALCPMCLKNA